MCNQKVYWYSQLFIIFLRKAKRLVYSPCCLLSEWDQTASVFSPYQVTIVLIVTRVFVSDVNTGPVLTMPRMYTQFSHLLLLFWLNHPVTPKKKEITNRCIDLHCGWDHYLDITIQCNETPHLLTAPRVPTNAHNTAVDWHNGVEGGDGKL